ncbi:MAG TPA: sulfotransferase [Steroidobacteraceae bacterium]|nr:sulfotransferase [Steroidobacteraceae bacterium]
MTGVSDAVGTLEVALKHAGRLLEAQPSLALEQAHEILRSAPRHPLATLFIGVAQRKLGSLHESVATLQQLAQAQPGWAPAHYELGVSLGLVGSGDAAVAALRHAVKIKPDVGDAWRLLGDHLSAMGDPAGADLAYANHVRHAKRDPRLLAPAAALCDNRIPEAEALLRRHLKEFPTDVAAIRMFAEVAARIGRLAESEALLARCLELAPGFTAARRHYALVLHRQSKPRPALEQTELLLAEDPRNPGYRTLKAAILNRIGEHDDALRIYDEVVTEYPGNANVWMSYGHSLKTAGRQADSIAAYRRSIGLKPGLGEAWWSLANLKTFRFEAAEIQAMRAQLERDDLRDEDRFHFHFALGKALEDAGDYAGSFDHYSRGNALRSAGVQYDAQRTTRAVRRTRRLCTREFLAERAGWGASAADPIFVLGLPRAGSTLVEQILSSHSLVEGTMELPDVPAMVRELKGGPGAAADARRYPAVLGTMSSAEFAALGRQYLERTRIQRKTGRPYFIDKMPNNWAHVGLIHLMLPNAKIIDARRHPMSCCFSGFKQHFARGQHFTYSLDDIGRYYRDYVELMAHFDEVLPGRVHRVIYEHMIDDTEHEVRRLLDYCGLPFEEGCLRFYENERAVRTASSEQVRKPIFREGIEHWRHYARWLGPLEAALGPALEAYPAAPPLAPLD